MAATIRGRRGATNDAAPRRSRAIAKSSRPFRRQGRSGQHARSLPRSRCVHHWSLRQSNAIGSSCRVTPALDRWDSSHRSPQPTGGQFPVRLEAQTVRRAVRRSLPHRRDARVDDNRFNGVARTHSTTNASLLTLGGGFIANAHLHALALTLARPRPRCGRPPQSRPHRSRRQRGGAP